MIKVLIDANVILDVLLLRRPWLAESEALWKFIEFGHGRGMLSAHAVTTIFYFVRKDRGFNRAKEAVDALLTVFGVAEVNIDILRSALLLNSTDFEDATTAAAAQAAGCGLIATRDPKGFRNSPVPAVSPKEALRAILARAT